MADIEFLTPNFKDRAFDHPFGTRILLSILRERNFDADITSLGDLFPNRQISDAAETIPLWVSNKSPKLVCFYTRCDVFHIDALIAEAIKKHNPATVIVFAGPHTLNIYADVLKKFPFVDYVCRGEGERTIATLAGCILAHEKPYDLPGLSYRQNNRIISNRLPDLVSVNDLDRQHLLLQKQGVMPFPDSPNDYYQLDSGRGCPYQCSFCNAKQQWQKSFRTRSVDSIIDEIALAKNEFGWERFYFTHDLFTVDSTRVMEFCHKLAKRNLDVHWGCSARVDTLNHGLIGSMAEAGLADIYLGIESGSNRIQKIIHKNLDIKMTLPIMKCLTDECIDVQASFIFGFPQETLDDFKRTLNLIDEIRSLDGRISPQLHACTYLPGTELTNEFFDRLRYNGRVSNICSNPLSYYPSEEFSANQKIYSHFYTVDTEVTKYVESNDGHAVKTSNPTF